MKKTLLVYYIVALIFVAGFATHGSENPEIFIYSYKYLAVLIALVLIFLVAIPWWINKYVNKNGSRSLLMAVVPSLLTIFLIYLGGHYYYYSQQEHLFDPFLQMPPTEYEFTEKDSNTYRILCIGGSTTLNIRLDTMDRYPSVLHKLMKGKIQGKKVEVLNAGMDWYTSKHSNINYAVYCRNYKPDVVIVMHAINDLYRSFSPQSLSVGEYKSDYTHFYGPSIAGAKPPTFESLINAFVRKFWFTPSVESSSFDIAEFKSLKDFPNYMSSLVELVQNDGAEVMIVSQPYFYKSDMTVEEDQVLWMDRGMCLIDGKYPDSETMALAMDAYNREASKIAEKYNLNYIHGERALPKDLDHFVDDVHYTAAGAQKLAEAIAQGILSSEN